MVSLWLADCYWVVIRLLAWNECSFSWRRFDVLLEKIQRSFGEVGTLSR